MPTKGVIITSLADVLVEIAPAIDYGLLDCPREFPLADCAALCASHFVVIPLDAADWGARGMATVRAAIERVQQHDDPDLKLRTFQMVLTAVTRLERPLQLPIADA